MNTQSTEVTPWEYQLLPLPLSGNGGTDESQTWLNNEGAKGWELVAVVPKMSTHPSLDCLAFMKRRRISQ